MKLCESCTATASYTYKKYERSVKIEQIKNKLLFEREREREKLEVELKKSGGGGGRQLQRGRGGK